MFSLAWWLSFSVGFLSLSQEILWVRTVSFFLRGMTYSFSIVLFFFLLGIAAGAAVGKRLCLKSWNLYSVSALVLGLASCVDFAAIAILPSVTASGSGLIVVCAFIFLTASIKSVMFPIAHHLGSSRLDGFLGKSISKVYFGNILGSALGPILTGYWLLDVLRLEHCMAFVGIGSFVLAIVSSSRSSVDIRSKLAGAAVVLVMGLLGTFFGSEMLPKMIEVNLSNGFEGFKLGQVIQNRHGIIHTLYKDGQPEVVFGGGEYDGKLSVDLAKNVNGLDRAAVMFAVHPNPKRVLVIGMSAGAWTMLAASSPKVEEIVVIEINRGYVELIKTHENVRPILSDPRVRIVFDDGRRWLRRNPNEKFDIIIQNTTFHWRTYATNLLSLEYMQLIKEHLSQDGIVGINSTGSGDVLKTAEAVFPFVARRSNFIYGSKSDFTRARAEGKRALEAMAINGQLLFPSDSFLKGGLGSELLSQPFMAREIQYLDFLHPNVGVVTDQNLLVEQAHGWPGVRKRFPKLVPLIDQFRQWQ